MWATVVLMALVAGRGPARIAAVIVISSKSRPVRAVGCLFGWRLRRELDRRRDGSLRVGRNGRWPSPRFTPLHRHCGGRIRSGGRGCGGWRCCGAGAQQDTAARGGAAETVAGKASRGIERLPAFHKLPQPVQNAVLGESVWVACIAGVAVGMPSVYYLAAIAAILSADARLDSSIAALVVFNVIAFILTEISIVSFVRAPVATRKWVDRLYTWATNRRRLVMGLLPGMVGIYLLVTGISKL